jgi:hypothetical protein
MPRVMTRANVPMTEENGSSAASIVAHRVRNVVFLTQYFLPFATAKPQRLSNENYLWYVASY